MMAMRSPRLRSSGSADWPAVVTTSATAMAHAKGGNEVPGERFIGSDPRVGGRRWDSSNHECRNRRSVRPFRVLRHLDDLAVAGGPDEPVEFRHDGVTQRLGRVRFAVDQVAGGGRPLKA